HEHALRAILEIPAATRVGLVIAANKFAQRAIADPLTLDQPIPPPVEREPAVDIGNVRPFGHAAQDDVVHERHYCASGPCKCLKPPVVLQVEGDFSTTLPVAACAESAAWSRKRTS